MLLSVGSLHDKCVYKMEFGATTSRSHRGKLGEASFFPVFSSLYIYIIYIYIFVLKVFSSFFLKVVFVFVF